MRAIRWLLPIALLAAAPSLRAAPEWFAIDPVHTRVLFFVEHARFSRSIGLLRPVEGGLWFDPEDLAAGRVDLCIPLTALDMGDRAWEDALRREDYFNARQHPDLCLRSTRIEVSGEGSGRLHGDLEVRGVERPVVFDFTVNDHRRYSLTLRRRVGISARAVLSRSDFGMVRDTTLVGDAVEVLVELEAQLADPPPSAQPTEDRP